MTVDASLAPIAEPADALAARLEDPQVRESLTRILDNADLLATMVGALDGLLRRAEVIGGSLSSGVGDFFYEPAKGLARGPSSVRARACVRAVLSTRQGPIEGGRMCTQGPRISPWASRWERCRS